MLNKFFSKKFKVNKTNIFLFSFLLTQIAVPTFELFKPSSANADTAVGWGASADSGGGSTALGQGATADYDWYGDGGTNVPVPATAIGFDSNASGDNSTAVGAYATATTNEWAFRTSATAIGGFSRATGDYSTALGDYSIA